MAERVHSLSSGSERPMVQLCNETACLHVTAVQAMGRCSSESLVAQSSAGVVGEVVLVQMGLPVLVEHQD